MSFEKLAPFTIGLPDGWKGTHLEFVAFAIGAFDVMMRRRWIPWWTVKGWKIHPDSRGDNETFWNWSYESYYPDPFSCLVEADKWYRDNVDKN